ncbi:MAG: hypothetical protein AAB506_01625, partial [Patescibacteria group bacterium]
CYFGIMVTASHIQASWNGFKFVKKHATPLDQGEILKIKKYCVKAIIANVAKPSIFINPVPSYIQDIISHFQNLKFSGKIIIDSGKTLVSSIAKEIFTQLGLNFIQIDPDRNLNPLLEESRQVLKTTVIKEKANFGIIWDGDGDRVIFVDSAGALIPPTFILSLFARFQSHAAFDIRAGRAAYTSDNLITPAWGQELKFAMFDNPKITFAGEASGHFIFRDWYCLDDGLYAALKFIELAQKTNLEKDLKILKEKYVEIPETNFEIQGDSTLVLKEIANYYRNRGESVSLVDGVTVEAKDFRFNLRPSLTEPYLRLNLEAKDSETSTKVFHDIYSKINRS